MYANLAKDFITDAEDPSIFAEMIKKSHWVTLEKEAGLSELNSWKYSLQALVQLLKKAKLTDQLVLLEYCIPSHDERPYRIDALVCGCDKEKKMNILAMEFKQWSDCLISKIQSSNQMIFNYKGKCRLISHPCTQAASYREQILEVMRILQFPQNEFTIHTCAYLHNCASDKPNIADLFHGEYTQVMSTTKLFTSELSGELEDWIQELVGNGGGLPVFAKLRKFQESCLSNYKLLPKMAHKHS